MRHPHRIYTATSMTICLLHKHGISGTKWQGLIYVHRKLYSINMTHSCHVRSRRMKVLLGFFVLSIALNTAGATPTPTPTPPTCENDICHMTSISGRLKISGVSSTYCTDTSALRTAIANRMGNTFCGSAVSQRACTADDAYILSCVVEAGNVAKVAYGVSGDGDGKAAALTGIGNVAALGTSLGLTVTTEEAAHVGKVDKSSNKQICTVSNGFLPINGVTAGTCNTNSLFFGGSSCSPTCASGAFLSREAKCSDTGVFEAAVCSSQSCGTGSVFNSATNACDLCIAGYGMNTTTGTCQVCTKPKYNNALSSDACADKSCIKGQGLTWHNSTHASCHACPDGQFSDSDTTGQCQPYSDCDAGHYVSQDGTNTANRECSQCPSGKFSSGKNSASCTTHKTCSAGEHQKTAGTATSDRVCVANVCTCVGGTAATRESCTSNNTHICESNKCNADRTYNPSSKMCDCKAGFKVVGNQCVQCPAGHWSLRSSASCDRCIAGYGMNTTTGTCQVCTKPKYNNVISGDACADKSCIKGQGFKWHNSTHASCHTCPTGQYSDSNDDGQCKDHTDCSPGQHEETAGSTTADRVCAPNVCTCVGGTAATGADCTQHNGKQCKADGCNSGYRFDAGAGQCVASTKHGIMGKMKIKGASSAFCNDTSRIRKRLAEALPTGTCGQAQSKCQPGQIKDRSCTFSPSSSTSGRRMLSTSSTTGNVDYVYSVETDPANAAAVTSVVTNSTAIQKIVQEEYPDDNMQVEETTAHATTTDTASGNIMCDISSGFMPVARGASLGTCANRTKFFAGESCSPVCENGAFLAKIASCDQFGVYDRAVCTQKQCTCQNGVKAVGATCNSHGDADCASCDTVFHLDIDAGGSGVHLCKANECSCANGKNVTGTACIAHQSNHCAYCFKGYYLNATSKACTACPSGTMQSVLVNANGASSCQSCPKGTAQPSTASSSCQECLDDQYTDQVGQATCTTQPTLSDLDCNHTAGKFPTKLPSKTTERACVSNPTCGDLDYHYTEQGMRCQTKCIDSLHSPTSACHLTREKFRQSPACSGSCRRRRTATLRR